MNQKQTDELIRYMECEDRYARLCELQDWKAASLALRGAIETCPIPRLLPGLGYLLREAEQKAKPLTFFAKVMGGVRV